MNTLKKARYDIASLGSTETEILEEHSSAKELFDEIQKLREEMYEAQKAAQAKAAEPFLEKIEELEAEYALFLKISS